MFPVSLYSIDMIDIKNCDGPRAKITKCETWKMLVMTYEEYNPITNSIWPFPFLIYTFYTLSHCSYSKIINMSISSFTYEVYSLDMWPNFSSKMLNKNQQGN